MPLLRRPGLTIAIALIVVALLVVAARVRGPVVVTAAATRTPLEQHIIASGRVRVVTRIQLSAQVSGRVVAVRVLDGQRVSGGELLAQIDDAAAKADVSQARAAVAQSSTRVEQLRKVGAIVATEGSRQAATSLARAEADLARLENLAAAGVAARADLENAQRAVEIARAQKSAADAQQIATSPSGVDSSIAVSVLAESQARLAGALVRLEQTRVVAPQDGVILTRSVEPGHTVQPGTPLFEMAADRETELVIEPDERNLAWVSLGQKARASADAYPQQSFDAEVSYIAPAIDPRRGSIEVRLRVPNPPAFLKPDMTVSVDLMVAAKSNALTVPSEAVRGAGTPSPSVLIVEGGRATTRQVTLGIRGEGRTEILSGLDERAQVVLSTDVALADGQRVRTRSASR